MIDEARRRACLRAMGVDLWLPRTPLPHAAPSRPAQLAEVAILPVASALPAARPVEDLRRRLAAVEPSLSAERQLPAACAEAERTRPPSSDISPKKSPRLRNAKVFFLSPPRDVKILTRPSFTMKKLLPRSSLRKMISPLR